MTHVVNVLDKQFQLFIEEARILEKVKDIAADINKELGDKNPIFLCVLNGSFFFAADLLRALNMPCEVSFVKVASYAGLQSSGKTTTLIGLDENLAGRNIVVVEDIVDTGRTMAALLEQLKALNPASIRVAALLTKPEAMIEKVQVDYVAFEVPDLFLIGYGLDYNKQGRTFRDIYILKDENN